MKTVRTILLGMAIIAAVGLYCHLSQLQAPEPVVKEYLTTHISNITEIQEQLRDAGYYNGEIDGKWGKLTDRAYCDWCAAQSFGKGSGL